MICEEKVPKNKANHLDRGELIDKISLFILNTKKNGVAHAQQELCLAH